MVKNSVGNKMKKGVLIFLKTILTITIIAFLARVLIKNWRQIEFTDLTFNWIYLVFSLGFFTAHTFLASALWGEVLRFLGCKIRFLKVNEIFAVSEFGRYVPGRVLLFVVRVSLCAKVGISKTNAVLSIAVDIALKVISATLVAVIAFGYWLPVESSLKVLGVIFLLFVVVVLLHPRVVKHIISQALRMLKVEHPTGNMRYKTLQTMISAYAQSEILQGVGFYMMLLSIYDAPITLLPIMIGISSFSWILGFLSILTPGGIGVREGVIVLLASPFVPMDIILVTVIFSRVFIIISEVLLWSSVKMAKRSDYLVKLLN